MKSQTSRIACVAVAVFVLDQLTKVIVRRSFQVGEHLELLPFFALDRVENTGAAFGIMGGQNTFFVISTLIILGFFAVTRKHLPAEGWPAWWGQGLIWGGALGNLADRFLFGRVTDFLDFFMRNWHWPSFNVADSSVTVGAGLLLWCTYRDREKPQ